MIFGTQFLVVKSPVSISGLRLTNVMAKVSKTIVISLMSVLAVVRFYPGRGEKSWPGFWSLYPLRRY